jgi:hypothetical protein
MPIHSMFLGFAKSTNDDMTEFYELLPAFWSPPLEVTNIIQRTPTDIEYQVFVDTKEDLENCLNCVTMEFLQKAWATYCETQELPVTLVPLSIVVRTYRFDND